MTDAPLLAAAPGDAAPDCTLFSTSGRDVTLSHYRGRSRVLPAFFPMASTPVCAGELCAQTEDDISIDLLSDYRRVVGRRYGRLLEDEFFSRRTYMVVGRDGAFAEADIDDRRETSELLARMGSPP